MDWEYNQYSLLSLIAGVISVTLSVYLWQRRTTPGAVALLLMMMSIAVWSLGSFLELGSTNLSDKIFWVKFQHLGMAPLPVAWLAFALQYTGRGKWLKGRTLALLSVIPLTTLILVWTNDAHHLFWRNLQLDTEGPFPMLAFTSGVWFWIDLAFSYLLISLGIFRLIQAYIYASHPYRTQAGILLIAAIAPLATNLLSLSNIEPFSHADTSPFAFTISGLALAWGLFLLRLLDVVPVARDAVIRDMPDAIIVLNTLNRIVDMNPSAERVIGRSSSEIVGQPVTDALTEKFLTPEVCGNVPEGHSETVLGEGETRRHYDLNISPVHDQRGRITGRLLTLRDITERKQAEESIKWRLRFEATVFTISSRFVGVSSIDEAINASLRDLGEFCGAGLSHLFLLREDGAIFSNTHEWCAQGATPIREHLQNLPVESLPWWMGKLRNGQVICITDISQLPEEADTEKRMLESLGINSLFAAPLVIRTEPGGFLGLENLAEPEMWTENNLMLLRVSSEIIGNALDRKWAEDKVRDANIGLQAALEQLKASQMQLLQSERLAAIGQLVAGVAHELNNPLMAISGMTELMLMDVEDPIIREGLHTLQSDGERATAIVRDLLSFARKQKPQRKTISINDVIESVVNLRSHTASLDNIRIMTDLDPGHCCVVADFQQLQQAFLNLLINAEQAMGEAHGEGTVTIRTQSIGESVRAIVSDDGPGIPPDILGKIFEPFFTTKEVGKGTGLGLSICYGIIHEHGGDIRAESKPGEGATFIIELQAAPESAGSPCAISAPTGERKWAEHKVRDANIGLQAALEQLKASHTHLLESERLKAIGQLVAGVAHELNNRLMAILGTAELMLMDVEDTIIREGLRTLQSDGERAMAIVRNLLSFARKQEPQRKTISVNDVIESVASIWSHAASLDNTKIMMNLDPDLPCIVADFQRLQQVFLNLFINAGQAIVEAHGEGTVTIRTQSTGEGVRATVSDDGPGVPPDILGKIFEPFFTTKEVGKGTGLGLSICYGIIHEHGGDIRAESKPGEGATFVIELPTVPKSVGSPCASSAPAGDRSALHDTTQNHNFA